ncbi:MAG: PD-(D/E)XK nuclease family protein [Thermoguttaceae bacterium]|jgi:ATP-dependent helicase/DNAse subunit B
MVASIVLVTGPAQSGKTQYLLSRYRAALRGGKAGSVLWLAPTWRAAAEVRNSIPGDDLSACWEPGVFTFDKFAQALIESSPDPIRPLTRSMKRQLVRGLIDEQLAGDGLRHFSPIASTGGLADLVCELISELKRLEIWPEDFRSACQARGSTAKDGELLDLYETYQLTLRENQLYDAEGRFWTARDRLQQGERRPFENLHLAVADGFTDFTRTQHEILELLAGWVDEILISLPLEPEPRRGDLFSKPLKTLSELKRRHVNLSIMELPRPENPSWPAMNHLEKSLFINPRTRATGSASAAHAPDTQGIEILSAAKPQGEMELVGARIKRLLAEENVRPGDIAVVFRRPQDAAGLAAEVFDRFGIPTAWEIGQTLDRIPVMRALKTLLQLDLEDWPFRGLLAVLENNYFQPDWPEWQAGKSAAIVEKSIRNLRIPHGRATLLDQLAAESADNPTLNILKRLDAAFDELPVKATLARWAKAWEKLAGQTGLLKNISQNKMDLGSGFRVQGPESRLQTTDSFYDVLLCAQDNIAWNRLRAALLAGEVLGGWRNRRADELDRKGAFQALEDMLRSERMPAADDESGRVRVLGAASVRSLQVPFLFLAGLSEKTFPAADREDRLYSEAEYLELIEKGLPLVARTERAREEMLLFYEVLTRATRRLYLSYPALDSAAQPLLPSPFVLEVIQACGGMEIERRPAIDIRPIPGGDEPLSPAQFRVMAVADALAPSGDISFLAGLMQGEIANLRAGLETIILRQQRDDFGPAEGILPGKAAHEFFAREFSYKRSFTASELEQYAACPFRFLLEKVLKLEPLEDIVLELDAPQRGQIVHGVLALFHRGVNQSLGRPGSPLELAAEEFDRLLQKALEDSLPRPSSNPVHKALGEINRRLITKWLAEYRKQCESYDKLWSEYDRPLAPEFFETSFGESKHRDAAAVAIEQALEFPDGNATILVSGRIDRIDTGTHTGINVFNILDYKSGAVTTFSPEDVKRGITLQLPIYALATAELILNDRDARPLQAGYWHIGKDGFKSRQSLIMFEFTEGELKMTADWENSRAYMTEIIPILVHSIRGGEYRVFNPDRRCTSYCPFSTICRIRQIRSLEKTWTPTP